MSRRGEDTINIKGKNEKTQKYSVPLMDSRLDSTSRKQLFNQRTTLVSGIVFCQSFWDSCCSLAVNSKENKEDTESLEGVQLGPP